MKIGQDILDIQYLTPRRIFSLLDTKCSNLIEQHFPCLILNHFTRHVELRRLSTKCGKNTCQEFQSIITRRPTHLKQMLFCRINRREIILNKQRSVNCTKKYFAHFYLLFRKGIALSPNLCFCLTRSSCTSPRSIKQKGKYTSCPFRVQHCGKGS